MYLKSINVGRPRLVMLNGATVSTAIFKTPVEGPVAIRGHNLEGDRQANLNVHGGPDKAVYGYPWEHYAPWAEELGRDDLAPEAVTHLGVLCLSCPPAHSLGDKGVELRNCQPPIPILVRSAHSTRQGNQQ